jgi:hypothetical protein
MSSSRSNRSNRSTGSSDSIKKFQEKYLKELEAEAQQMTIKKIKDRIHKIENYKKGYEDKEEVINQFNNQIKLLTNIRNYKKQEEKTKHPIRASIAHFLSKRFRRGGKTKRRTRKYKK